MIVLLFVTVLLILARYKVAGPDQAFIITGRKGREVRNPETGQISTDLSGQKVVMGGGVFVVPFVQKRAIRICPPGGSRSRSAERCPGRASVLNLDAVAIVKVGGNEDSIRAAAQRFLSQQEEVETFTQEVLSPARCAPSWGRCRSSRSSATAPRSPSGWPMSPRFR